MQDEGAALHAKPPAMQDEGAALHAKPTAMQDEEAWLKVEGGVDTQLMQALLEQVQCLHREWADAQSNVVRLSAVEGVCHRLLIEQRRHNELLLKMHKMIEHLYHEHNRSEVRKRNAAIRRKAPMRFMPEASSAEDSTDLYDLLEGKGVRY